MAPPLSLSITLPPWTVEVVDWSAVYPDDEARMRFAIDLARRNVAARTGGPFGAAIFERESGRLIGVGMNSVVRENNCVLHGEMVAFMVAQHRLGSFTLAAPGMPEHQLVTSCEPCAMCLGAILWSGVKDVVCGAARRDATALGFEEGPVFPSSYAYLEERGVAFSRGLLRREACEVMQNYRAASGKIYNA